MAFPHAARMETRRGDGVSLSHDSIPATLSLDTTRACEWDAIIIGAGPAGAIAARELARRGAQRVLMLDRAHFPRPKVCGSCLTGLALATLRQVGLDGLLQSNGAHPLTRFILASGRRRATLPLRAGCSLSRDVLDAALVRAAIGAGVDFHPGVNALLPLPAANQADLRRVIVRRLVDGHETALEASVIIAADGLGARRPPDDPTTSRPFTRHSHIGGGVICDDCPEGYPAGEIAMALGRRGYVGFVRLEDGRLNIATAMDPDLTQNAGGIGAAAAEIIRGCDFPSVPGIETMKWRGVARLAQRPQRVTSEGVFVIGDAAGYIEPFTGEGMGWAMASALAIAPIAADAIERGWTPAHAAAWERSYRQTIGRKQRWCRLIAWALRRPMLVRATLAALAEAPGITTPIMNRMGRPAKHTPFEWSRPT